MLTGIFKPPAPAPDVEEAVTRLVSATATWTKAHTANAREAQEK